MQRERSLEAAAAAVAAKASSHESSDGSPDVIRSSSSSSSSVDSLSDSDGVDTGVDTSDEVSGGDADGDGSAGSSVAEGLSPEGLAADKAAAMFDPVEEAASVDVQHAQHAQKPAGRLASRKVRPLPSVWDKNESFDCSDGGTAAAVEVCCGSPALCVFHLLFAAWFQQLCMHSTRSRPAARVAGAARLLRTHAYLLNELHRRRFVALSSVWPRQREATHA